ncbi:hypothetical protein J2S30_003276 [Herbaspirillum rubrisubalbicans]|uniref:WbqC family protein n=1 Tax=Herbaspirillum rubrisubalbicans TaxID=80842 RepID=UPI0015598144|nr:WbqC family protein [Herbaspirillum rubrisubalbicans]MCP1574897.1 hypothetical protein [Herbaspirillum rubrisubalbicans]NQE51272.1 hypothetical protein [Herbaspirillum rubrisubalbicans]
MKTVAILQSNYIPWKGYFDMIAAVDEFILYDDMQYTRRDWRNRNMIKTPQGTHWMTVPVKVKGKYFQSIRQTELDGTNWAQNHWKTLLQNYRKAPCFEQTATWLEPLYLGRQYQYLAELNSHLIEAICAQLGVATRISRSSDYVLAEGKTERLVDLCRQANATRYISGPAALDYIDASQFERAGIELQWFDYDNYPVYPQLWGEFTHYVSILDLFFNCGEQAGQYMKYVHPATHKELI